ncbi:hypothetical protein ACE1SV_67500 [Streptomyces sp. E-15]
MAADTGGYADGPERRTREGSARRGSGRAAARTSRAGAWPWLRGTAVGMANTGAGVGGASRLAGLVAQSQRTRAAVRGCLEPSTAGRCLLRTRLTGAVRPATGGRARPAAPLGRREFDDRAQRVPLGSGRP